jgi:predicted RNA-binding Zn ribbon-like protein
MKKERSLKTLPLDGGILPFHFINTVYAWRGENLHEYLNSYEELLEWCNKVRMLPNSRLTELREFAIAHPKKKQQAFANAKQLRRTLYQFFSGVAGQVFEPAVLQQYNRFVRDTLVHFEWQPIAKLPQYILKDQTTDLRVPLWMIVHASHRLLFEVEFTRIKECSRCGWIFLDKTRNNKRRWCNPSSCGSVEKMHRYYQKVRSNKL